MKLPNFDNWSIVFTTHYGNTGCGVFKGGIQKLESFLAKNLLYSNEITKC